MSVDICIIYFIEVTLSIEFYIWHGYKIFVLFLLINAIISKTESTGCLAKRDLRGGGEV